MLSIQYCCVCDEDTPHKVVLEDTIFAYAVQCMRCETIWQAEPPVPITKEKDAN